MADYTETISLADYKVGDRWVGVSSILPTVNGATPSNALARVRMTFKLGTTSFVLDTVGSQGITIDNSATWAASIAARDSFLTLPGRWTWIMEFWQSGIDAQWSLYGGIIRVWDDD